MSEWKRLLHGICKSGPIFQENIDHTFLGIPMTTCRVADIFISGMTNKDHIYNLNYVIMVLEYLEEVTDRQRHKVSQEGIRPLKRKEGDGWEPKRSEILVSLCLLHF